MEPERFRLAGSGAAGRERRMKILCIGPTPAAQRVMVFSRLKIDTVNRASTTLSGAAGKGVNVAKVLKVLGANPVALGFLGGDRGERLKQILAEQGVETDFVDVPAPTRECVTLLDQDAKATTELVEESRPVAADLYDQLRQKFEARLPGRLQS
jgi:tagatose 6-phosphate kinase